MKPTPWHPLRRMRDWDRREARALRDIRNRAGDVIPAGAVCQTVGAPRGRVHISCRLDPPPRPDRYWVHVRNVKVADVELIGNA